MIIQQVRNSITENRIVQGDIFKSVPFIEYSNITNGELHVSLVEFPYVVVLTQDCDLLQENNNFLENCYEFHKRIINESLIKDYDGKEYQAIILQTEPSISDFSQQNNIDAVYFNENLYVLEHNNASVKNIKFGDNTKLKNALKNLTNQEELETVLNEHKRYLISKGLYAHFDKSSPAVISFIKKSQYLNINKFKLLPENFNLTQLINSMNNPSKYEYEAFKEHSFDKKLVSTLVVPLYNASLFWKGEHVADLGYKATSYSPNDSIKNNQNPRYHFLTFSQDIDLGEMVVDFKHYFTISNRYLESNIDNKVCTIDFLFRENLSHRFAFYLSRIGLPE